MENEIVIKKKPIVHEEEENVFLPSAPASGPLSDIYGDLTDCYINTVNDVVSIKLCLFHNISFGDVLDNNEEDGLMFGGVWQGWEIQNNKYKTMVFEHTECPDDDQLSITTRVHLKAVSMDKASDTGFKNFKTTDLCNYQVTLSLPIPDISVFVATIESAGVLREIPADLEIISNDDDEKTKEIPCKELSDVIDKLKTELDDKDSIDEIQVLKASLNVLERAQLILSQSSQSTVQSSK